jgi:hypothetical protein
MDKTAFPISSFFPVRSEITHVVLPLPILCILDNQPFQLVVSSVRLKVAYALLRQTVFRILVTVFVRHVRRHFFFKFAFSCSYGDRICGGFFLWYWYHDVIILETHLL